MSSTSAGPAAAGPRATPTRRAALTAAGILVALVAVVLVAHAANNPTPTAAASGGTSGMSAMPTSGAPAAGSNTVMTIQGAALPSMSSTAMPAAMSIVPLGQADWDGMKIQARTSAPATFLVFNGTSQQLVRPTAKDSFHLMVLLSDEYTGFAIPYSSVWATFTKGGKIVYDERLWPMISRYMGPHYGANVPLPSAGLYHVSLLVSPPAAARHLEYKNLWVKPHKVNLAFRWAPKGA